MPFPNDRNEMKIWWDNGDTEPIELTCVDWEIVPNSGSDISKELSLFRPRFPMSFMGKPIKIFSHWWNLLPIIWHREDSDE